MSYTLTATSIEKRFGLTTQYLTRGVRANRLTRVKAKGMSGRYLYNEDEVRRYSEVVKSARQAAPDMRASAGVPELLEAIAAFVRKNSIVK